MQRHTIRYLALFGVLLAGVAGSLWTLQVGRRGALPSPAANRAGEGSAGAEMARAPLYLYHVDLATWYAASADEVVVSSPHDLGMMALNETLPMRLGRWQGSDLPPSQDVIDFYRDPPLVLRRQYDDEAGRRIWMTAIGASGAKSYRIFEHTPDICYGGPEWTTLADRVERLSLKEGGTLPIRYGLYERSAAPILVYYWFQRPGPATDAAEGTISWRLATDAGEGVAVAEARLNELIGLLYERTFDWHRF